MDGNSFVRHLALDVVSCGIGPDPVSNWDFDEGSGSVVRDAAGSNDGTLNGDVFWTGDTPDSTGTALSFDGNGSTFTVTRKSVDMPLNRWHFIAFVYDSPANSMYIYYDGILDETAISVSLPAMAGVDLSIGADAQGSGNFFEGLIDGVAIYDQVLTEEEIRESY
jgi:hypothetical protein